MQTLNNKKFCLHLRGTTGWATRLPDFIYAGCISVIIVDATMHPFEDFLDWRKFSIRIPEDQFGQIEEILLSYSSEQLEQMQQYVLRVRDAFTYLPDAKISDLDYGGGINPIRLTLASFIRRQRTIFPSKDIKTEI